MKNFNFYWLLLAAGIFFAYGQKNSSENENASKDPKEETKNVSDSKSSEKEVKKYYQRDFLIEPREKLLISQKLFQGRKPGFLEDDDFVSHTRIPIGNKRQNLHLTDNSVKYDALLKNFQEGRPRYFQAASDAISAPIVNQNNSEYIPYSPSRDLYNYPQYGGHPRATKSSVIKTYERSTSSRADALPLVDIGQQNLGKVFGNNIYQRSFPQFGNFKPGLYSGRFFSNGAPNQVRNAERINKWPEDHTNEYAPVERVF